MTVRYPRCPCCPMWHLMPRRFGPMLSDRGNPFWHPVCSSSAVRCLVSIAAVAAMCLGPVRGHVAETRGCFMTPSEKVESAGSARYHLGERVRAGEDALLLK
jgi:hypothetical protein